MNSSQRIWASYFNLFVGLMTDEAARSGSWAVGQAEVNHILSQFPRITHPEVALVYFK